MSIATLLAAAAALLFVSLLAAWFAPRVWLGSTVLGLLVGSVPAIAVLCGAPAWEWRSQRTLGGEPLHFTLDGVSAFFLVVPGFVGAVATVYGREYWSATEHPRSVRAGRVWWSVLMTTLMLLVLTSNGLHFLIAWELFAVSAYFLITLDRSSQEVRAAGWLYLAASHLATLALLAFFTLLAARTGSWDLGPLREQSDLAPLFWLALLGFGLKAGMFPLHIWLPSAHANAPSHVSAVLSGVTLKVAIYGLVRFTGWLPTPAGAGTVVATLGVVSAVLGVAFALGQHDLKRLLAYHSVENIGIILIGFGFALMAVEHGGATWGRLALAGALLHVWNHALFKGLLFLGAGSVLHSTGTREMSRLGGLWRAMPWTAGLFALGAVAISGLPPLNGFVSEWLVYLGLFDATLSHASASWVAMGAAVLLAVTGALALACFVKVCGIVFLGAPRSQQALEAHECGPSMRGAMLTLALACGAIGLLPFLFWPALTRATAAWNPGWSAPIEAPPLHALSAAHVAVAVLASLGAAWLWRRARHNGLRRSATWDCGYAHPAPRMQYTAGSFASTITAWFAFILRPQTHGRAPTALFPTTSSHTSHTPETVLEFIVQPIARFVLRGAEAARRLQQGRVQFYVLYVLIGLAVLASIALFLPAG